MKAEPQAAEIAGEHEAIAVLDVYIDKLRAGNAPDKAAILKSHPELAPVLGCLDDLQFLAQSVTVGSGSPPMHADDADAPTMRPTDDPGPPTPPFEHSSPPTEFGDYELLGTLGRGGMGIVYKARQKSLNRLVAIKMILSSQLATEEEIHRFHAESRAAAGLRHPHILQIHEAGCLLGQHYFSMQFVEGNDLAHRCRQRPFSPEESAHCILAVTRAVAYLHERDIVHRDLKPSNILLDDTGWPYVTDFGLVKMLTGSNHATSTGAIVGTPSYMAPEQAAGRNAEVGPLSDVYSLGAILYELLTGRPPFSEASPFDTLVQVLEGEPALPRTLNPKVPRELELICLKAMSKSPERRYQSAAALADDLDRFLRGDSVSARPQSLRQKVARWARQEPGLASRLVVLAAGSLIAQVYYQLSHPVSLLIHSAIMGILAVWALVSLVCQAMIRRNLWPDRARLAWLATDGLLLTTALVVDEAFHSPLVLIFGVYIVASGLWFRTGLVWFTTAVAACGYTVLLLFGLANHDLGESPQHHLIAMITLILLGLMVASQVRRVRALSRYYDHRPLP